jgi:hypothetical protein
MAKKDLLLLEQLPAWRKDNPYVLQGYRPLTDSYHDCLRTLAQLHNQTINIYTHLLGLLLFFLLAYVIQHSLHLRHATATYEDAIAFGSFFVGLFACLGFSAGFHIFLDHSKRVHDRWLAIDFFGILCLVAGSWVPGIYYGFYCQRSVARFYLTMVNSQKRRNSSSVTANTTIDIISIVHLRYGLPCSTSPNTKMAAFSQYHVLCAWHFRVPAHETCSHGVWGPTSTSPDGLGLVCTRSCVLHLWYSNLHTQVPRKGTPRYIRPLRQLTPDLPSVGAVWSRGASGRDYPSI